MVIRNNSASLKYIVANMLGAFSLFYYFILFSLWPHSNGSSYEADRWSSIKRLLIGQRMSRPLT